jgi:radical SAM superfamily enzyme YgiQ (UPF0313 family)
MDHPPVFSPFMGTPANSPIHVLLVGYEKQQNLGLRSILAYVRATGFRAEIVPFARDCPEAVLRAAQALRPRMIGFSLIFQFALGEFAGLMRTLRQNGVTAHFTAGGHFPSLRPSETLALLPDLDSIVRFEGEETLVEFLGALDQPARWPDIRGLAFRRGSNAVVTELRPLIADLDSLPTLDHGDPVMLADGVPMASMLASRGCLFNCSFCSIRQFYGSAGGALRRTRSPQRVVAEMKDLHDRQGVRVFLFQDDDFAARTPRQREWLHAYLDALDEAGLAERVKWKISCRVDDLDRALLGEMTRRGLIMVYLGVESGNPDGLRLMNKRVTVGQNQAAIALLHELDIEMAMGFMLLDPSSTFAILRENIDFLEAAGASGRFPINFCRMLPYAGTPIEAQLRAEGRLTGTLIEPDYDFLEPRIGPYAYLVNRIFRQRNNDRAGLVARLSEASFDHRLDCALNGRPEDSAYRETLRGLTCRANALAVRTLRALLDTLETGDIATLLQEQGALLRIAEDEWRGEADIAGALGEIV